MPKNIVFNPLRATSVSCSTSHHTSLSSQGQGFETLLLVLGVGMSASPTDKVVAIDIAFSEREVANLGLDDMLVLLISLGLTN